MSRNYKFHNKAGLYFVSFATVNWIDVFTRQVYFDVLADSVSYCRAEKGMESYAYCFMPSHCHFVFRSANDDPSGLLRDFKRHTAKKLIEAIENNPKESRKELLLWLFESAGKKNAPTSKYQFWQHHNKPIELWSEHVIKQKIDYIHNNQLDGLNIYLESVSKTVVVQGQLNTDAKAVIYDMQGRLVLQQALDTSSQSNSINVNSLNTGVYIVELKSKTHNRTQKFIIN